MDKIVDLLSGITVVAIIFLLVRPNSRGPEFVKSVGNAYSGVLGTATGQNASAGGWGA